MRARIVKIGRVKAGVVSGWHMEGDGMTSALEVHDGVLLFGGYTIEELSEISQLEEQFNLPVRDP